MNKLFKSKISKICLISFVSLVFISCLVVCSIYFTKYEFNNADPSAFWLKYFLLCMIVISSSVIISIILLTLNYLYKNSLNKNAKIKKEGK